MDEEKLHKINEDSLNGMYKFPFGMYSNLLQFVGIKKAGLKKGEIVLDFGCGQKQLSKKLSNFNVHNYDIDPHYNEVDDYRKIKPDAIFALNVLEHLNKEQSKILMDEFATMNKELRWIMAIPKENILNQVGRIMSNIKEPTDQVHILTTDKIYGILGERMTMLSKTHFCFMSELSVGGFK